MATQLDPRDFLIYTGLVYEIGASLEERRLPISDGCVFSYRFAPDTAGRFFDSAIGYSQFQQESDRISSESAVSHVAVADIADFYQRLYHHAAENAMAGAAANIAHVKAIMRLLGGWTERVSYGIPVGISASRLIAETTIAGTDESLAAAGYRFVRFNDDYRIFVGSHSEGYRALAFLAQQLHDTYGLTLQTEKTTVIDCEAFRSRFLPTPEEVELLKLREQWHSLANQLGLDSAYGTFDDAQLSDEQRALVDSQNLPEMFRAELEREEGQDIPVMRFILRRLAQRGTDELVDDTLNHMDQLYQLLPTVIEYYQSLQDESVTQRHRIGERILDLVDGSLVSELEYHQMWLLDLFASSTVWNHESRFIPLIGRMGSLLVRRKLVLAMGRAHLAHWFISRRTYWAEESPWVRRAFLLGASCMPSDQRKHWYRSVAPRLDSLDRAIVKWATDQPL